MAQAMQLLHLIVHTPHARSTATSQAACLSPAPNIPHLPLHGPPTSPTHHRPDQPQTHPLPHTSHTPHKPPHLLLHLSHVVRALVAHHGRHGCLRKLRHLYAGRQLLCDT